MPTSNKAPSATTLTELSHQPGGEHDRTTPAGPGQSVHKARTEAAAESGAWAKVKAIGREIDRNIAGEYERREDLTGKPVEPTKR